MSIKKGGLKYSKNAKSVSLTDFWWGCGSKNFIGVSQIPIFAFFFAVTIVQFNLIQFHEYFTKYSSVQFEAPN